MNQVKPLAQESDVVQFLEEESDSEHIGSTSLTTNQRVIARVTDGIYRQPGSSLRELISNSYDADASRVVITTDAPRFEKIIIEDDGNGMSPKMLAHMLYNIGGSAKRNDRGKQLGLTASEDARLSPGGRRLIGRIGIGLFSVSQLTHKFQIITKTKGDPHRIVATVVLRQFSDEPEDQEGDNAQYYEAGRVNLWRERAEDVESHGTTIVLTSIRPQTRDTLRSRDIWNLIERTEADGLSSESIKPPKYHIGRVLSDSESREDIQIGPPSVPWKQGDSPDEAFRSLVDCVWDELHHSNPNPRLERLFDFYLQMIWQIGLAAPLPYYDQHVRDVSFDNWTRVFRISNETRTAATSIEGDEWRSMASKHNAAKQRMTTNDFQVFVDDLELKRPIRFRSLPKTNHALKKPLLFAGSFESSFEGRPRELTGGALKFDAYLVWAPKIVPTEHRGVLVRIHEASGTLFDSTFLRYQVAEHTRLSQIVCEISVTQGLEGALNIDRESFNSAHPHAVVITKWLHNALRQVASAQKRVAAEVRDVARQKATEQKKSQLIQIVNTAWQRITGDEDSSPPLITFATESTGSTEAGDYTFDSHDIFTDVCKAAVRKAVEEKVTAITQVLAAYGLLEELSEPERVELVRTIAEILEAE